jgi:AcrR family transcriptional regulator
MEAKTDRRIKRTRYLLVHALTSLMLKKSIKDITVKELCESVDINRGTFYLHYKFMICWSRPSRGF